MNTLHWTLNFNYLDAEWTPGLFLLVSFLSSSIVLSFRCWKTNRVPTMGELDRVLPYVFRNLVFAAFVYHIGWKIRYMCLGVERVFPQLFIGIDLILLYYLSQFCFFFGHKFLHFHPWIYRNFHQMHHEYRAPFAFTALYCTMTEMFVANLAAVFWPVWIMNPSLIETCIWFIMVGIYTPLAHASMLNVAGSRYHWLHHQRFNVNFGCQLLDKVFGCYAAA